MPKSTTFSNGWLNLTFRAEAIANLAQNNATAPLTNLHISLHTADPGVGGSQATSEVAYTGYARVAVSRSATGWTASTAGSTSPVANIDFPVGTGGTGTVTHFAIGSAATGAGVVYYTGTVTPNITVGNGVQPRLTTATAISEA